MKKIKKICFWLLFCFSLAQSFLVFSAQSKDVVVSLQINNPIMKVNGVNTEIDKGEGTKPVIINGRTLVPVRAIIEAFDGTVQWDGARRTVTLNMENDTIELEIGDSIAYYNDKAYTLEAAPCIINERTMLPIRFIAENFNIAVAWNNDTKTVFLVRNFFDEEEYERLMSSVPEYSGEPYVLVNHNKPYFRNYELIDASFEYYSKLDNLGRCGVCMASVGEDIMPTEKRGSISSVTPTGWINAQYDNVDGKYLYNRCHLIGFQLTGENANKRNLITGTRYLNVDAMLIFENMVDDYIEKTGNNVVYRSTPVFEENNLLADGVLLEGYSVEDNGKGISFCVYCYNVQPGIFIDYKTGKSSIGGNVQNEKPQNTGATVYRTPTGKKYHLDMDCGGKNSYSVDLDSAINSGLTPCSKCAD